jgi:hypothetical protein
MKILNRIDRRSLTVMNRLRGSSVPNPDAYRWNFATTATRRERWASPARSNQPQSADPTSKPESNEEIGRPLRWAKLTTTLRSNLRWSARKLRLDESGVHQRGVTAPRRYTERTNNDPAELKW